MSETARVAIYWDKSYLWGLIAYRAFRLLGIDFDILSAADVRAGSLAGHDIVFVPGGWASDKIAALQPAGAVQMRRFVEGGGSYLGFCGGAGLALSHESGLGLAPFGRLPTSQRLPSFSGKIVLRHEDAGHDMWRDVADGTAFYAWWPGQFAVDDAGRAKVLASYGSPMPGSFVTDLPVGPGFDWPRWEKSYGINLDPARISGEPAVVELGYGRGRVILSYLHFETPEDDAGHAVLLNLIAYLSGGNKPVQAAAGAAAGKAVAGPEGAAGGCDSEYIGSPGNDESNEVRAAAADGRRGEGNRTAGPGLMKGGLGEAAAAARDLERKACSFIRFGKENFLWFWRSSWLLQWRRGVKGIEYSTIYGMLAELDRLAEKYDRSIDPPLIEKIHGLKELVVPFFLDARELIIAERFAMTHGPISPLRSDDPDIQRLRARLFSADKRCGGLYEEIIDQVDEVLLPLLRRELAEKR